VASEQRNQLDPSDETMLAARPAGLGPKLLVAAAAGLLAAAIGAAMSEEGLRRFLLAYLVAFSFALSLSLGAMFFVLIQHLTRAGWSVLVRRPAEIMAANMPVVALLFIPIAISVALGHGKIYPWAQPESAAVDHSPAHEDVTAHYESHAIDMAPPAGYGHQQLDTMTLKKRSYLNRPFFLLRWAAYLGIWAAIASWYLRRSADEAADAAASTMRMEHWAGPLLVVYGLTVTFAAWDLLMSLNPHWYSTIFGVYYFSGAVVGSLAALILALLWLQNHGVLTRSVTLEHYHDLGKLLFGFTVFWAYIAFSQYLLIWYANMPETTGWYMIRGATTVAADINAWTWIALLLLLGHFVLPFLGLMPRSVKRRPLVLGLWAAWLLAMHYVDLLWLVMPELGPALALGPIEIGLLLAVMGVYAAGALRRAAAVSLVATHDPRLKESLEFANV
jgi:hypothetical protein